MKESLRKNVLGAGAAIVAALVGMTAVKMLGSVLLWPTGLIGFTWLILAKCKLEPAAVPMLAFVIGQTLWMIVGYAILYSIGRLNDWSFLIDVVLVAGVSTWFVLARSRAAAIGILVYQICALGFGLLLMGQQAVPGLSNQQITIAYTIHIILRIGGIGLCIYAIMKLGKGRPASAVGEIFD